MLALATALRSLPHGLRHLNLADCGFGPRGAVVLSKAIAANIQTPTALQQLVLRDNPIGPDGVQSVLELLASSNVVDTLDLSGTGCACDQVLGKKKKKKKRKRRRRK